MLCTLTCFACRPAVLCPPLAPPWCAQARLAFFDMGNSNTGQMWYPLDGYWYKQVGGDLGGGTRVKWLGRSFRG